MFSKNNTALKTPSFKPVQQRWKAWLDRRIPAAKKVTLNQRRIFVFPTWMGCGYLFTAFLLFLAGVNYGNTLILSLSFFLGSLFVVTILQTFGNLSGLVIKAGSTESAFAGKESEFLIHLEKSRNKNHCSISLEWMGYESSLQDLNEHQKISVQMLLPTKQRGIYRPQRLLLKSVYPLGLCRAWTWVDLDMVCYVYPAPFACEYVRISSGGQQEAGAPSLDSNDDFIGLRPYKDSDAFSNVDWKAFARRGELYAKQYQGYQSELQWIEWQNIVGDKELRLSKMAFLILEFSKKNIMFGLRLPSENIEPDFGVQHQKACLEALARF